MIKLNKYTHIASLLVIFCANFGHVNAYQHYDDEDLQDFPSGWDQAPEPEHDSSPSTDTYTEYDDGSETTVYQPRSMGQCPRMSAEMRQYIFQKCEDLAREALILKGQAQDMQNQIIDIDARAAFAAIFADAAGAWYGGTYTCIATCGYIVTELGYHAYAKYPEWQQARSYMQQAQNKFEEIYRLEEMLWYDDNA
jgi:hypothetical protein